ncbi:MAG: hypothetical protein IAG10_19785, partial [Planctomycetaceae bacterium]|nr:hypothetical protein [Planctomycetaceae bacterium]
LDIDEAVNNFIQGRVMISYGLLAELSVNEKYRSGETVACGDDELRVDVRVLGPHWVRASQVQLFSNGHMIREAAIPSEPDSPLPTGVKWAGGWTIPKPHHDVHLVAIATGPGVDGLYWRMAKPYQPTSPIWEPRVIGCSGAIWLDADKDGRRTSARDYAERLVAASTNDVTKLIESLSTYDEAVAAQAAHLLRTSGLSLQSQPLLTALKTASSATQAGFRAYAEAWRENEIVRVSP